jgi:uncharacterized membrane-anchored protein
MTARWALAATAALAMCGAAVAQDKPEAGGKPEAPAAKWPPKIPGVEWTNGPATCKLRDLSEVKIPEGWSFTGGDGTRTLMKLMGNLVGTQEVGSVYPGSLDWFAVFEFDPSGYVKDDEKSNLDADAILESKRETNKAGNEERKRLGLPTMELLGWDVKPHYDDATHNLEWSLRLKSEKAKGETLNYEVRLLGRKGVMQVALVADPATMPTALPPFRRLLADHAFVAGEDYGSYRAGDKVAEYGLAALVTGGAVAIAAKTGLLAKLWKFIVFGVLAVVGWIKRSFSARKPAAPPKR